MLAVPLAIGAAVVGAAALTRRPGPAGVPAPPVESLPAELPRETGSLAAAGQKAPETEGGNLGDLAKGGALAVITAAGAIFGSTVALETVDRDNTTTRTAAPIIGGAVAGGLFVAAGGLAAGSLAAAAVVAAPVVVAAAAVTQAVVGIVNAVESHERAAKLHELQDQRDALLRGKAYAQAWDFANEWAAKGYGGLHFKIDGAGLEAAPDTVPMSDGTTKNVRETLNLSYSMTQAELDLARKAGLTRAATPQALGDEWATAFESASPWVNPGAFHRKPPAPPTTAAQAAARAKEINTDRAEAGLTPLPAPPPAPAPKAAGVVAPKVTVAPAKTPAKVVAPVKTGTNTTLKTTIALKLDRTGAGKER